MNKNELALYDACLLITQEPEAHTAPLVRIAEGFLTAYAERNREIDGIRKKLNAIEISRKMAQNWEKQMDELTEIFYLLKERGH